MLKKRSILIILLTLSLILSGIITNADPVSSNSTKLKLPLMNKVNISNSDKYVEGEVIVTFRKNIGILRTHSIASGISVNSVKRFNTLSNIRNQEYAVLKSDTKSTEQMIKELETSPNVESASPNYILKIDVVSNDTDFLNLWGMHNTGQFGGTVDADIDAAEAWDISTGSTDVIIAGVDTGIDYNHPDLMDNMWINPNETAGNGLDDDSNGYVDDVYGINAILNNGDPMDDNGHGTHTAGTFAGVGNNSTGVTGVCWTAKIMAL